MKDYSELSPEELKKELGKAEGDRNGEAYVRIIEAGGFEVQYPDLYEQGIASIGEKEKELERLVSPPKERNSLEDLARLIEKRLQKGGVIIGNVSSKLEEQTNGSGGVKRVYDFRDYLDSCVIIQASHDTMKEAREEETIDNSLKNLDFYLKSKEAGFNIIHNGDEEVTISSIKKSGGKKLEDLSRQEEGKDAEEIFNTLIDKGFRIQDYPEVVKECLKRRGRKGIIVNKRFVQVSRANKGQLKDYAEGLLKSHGYHTTPAVF